MKKHGIKNNKPWNQVIKMDYIEWEKQWITASLLLNKSDFELRASLKCWNRDSGSLEERNEHTRKAKEYTKEAIEIMNNLVKG